MGCCIAKFAFMPPPKHLAEHSLRSNDAHDFAALGDASGRVSFLHYYAAAAAAAKGGGGATVTRRARYTLLYSHGNAEDIAHSADFFQALSAALKVDVVAYDYCGYGLSTGTCSEASAYASVEAVHAYLTDVAGIPAHEIVVVGRSLGSGPSCHLAAKHRGFAGLVLLSPFKSCANVAGRATGCMAYPFDIFANIRKIGKVSDCPVMIIHGDADTVIDVSHGKALEAEARRTNGRVTAHYPAGCDHNDVLERMAAPSFGGAMAAFIAAL
jgi:fermentation-respiration switch protein FrsA (DUF1100 family)